MYIHTILVFPGGASGKEPACQCRRHKRCGFDPWVGKIPWRRSWQPTPVFLPGESHGQRSLAGYGPWSHEELDTIEVTKHARKRGGRREVALGTIYQDFQWHHQGTLALCRSSFLLSSCSLPGGVEMPAMCFTASCLYLLANSAENSGSSLTAAEKV